MLVDADPSGFDELVRGQFGFGLPGMAKSRDFAGQSSSLVARRRAWAEKSQLTRAERSITIGQKRLWGQARFGDEMWNYHGLTARPGHLEWKVSGPGSTPNGRIAQLVRARR
jgi:hypothetical protein